MSYIPNDKDWSKYDNYIPSKEALNHYGKEENENGDETTAGGAFLRSAIKGPAKLTYSLLSALGLPAVPVEEAAPKLFKEGDIKHPIASTAGEYALPFGAAGKTIGLGLKSLNAIKESCKK